MLTGCEHKASDLAQETNLRILNRYLEGKLTEVNSSYISRTAFSVFIDGKRKDRRLREKFDDYINDYSVKRQKRDTTELDILNSFTPKLTGKQILFGLKGLTKPEKNMLYLRWFSKYEFAEIAAASNVKEATIKGIYQRAQNHFKSITKGEDFDKSDLFNRLDGHDAPPEMEESLHIKLTPNGKTGQRIRRQAEIGEDV